MARYKRHNADLFIVIALFFVYALCALTLCVLGANFYSQTVAVSQEGYDQRSGVLYIAQKVHQNDIGGGVRVDRYNDTDALVLIEQTTGEGYETWIFIKDGYLCEQLIPAGSAVIDEQAQKIMPMKALALALGTDNMLAVSVTTDSGALNEINLTLRSSGGTYNQGTTPPASSSTGSFEETAVGPTVMTPAPGAGGEG